MNMGLLTWCLLQDSCQKSVRNRTLTSTRHVDLTKVFDTVSRHGLWRIMAKYGRLEKSITFVRQFHDGMHTRVQDNRKSSVAFPLTNGFNRGCVTDFLFLFGFLTVMREWGRSRSLFFYRDIHVLSKEFLVSSFILNPTFPCFYFTTKHEIPNLFHSYTNFGFPTLRNISKSIKIFYLVFHGSAVTWIYINRNILT